MQMSFSTSSSYTLHAHNTQLVFTWMRDIFHLPIFIPENPKLTITNRHPRCSIFLIWSVMAVSFSQIIAVGPQFLLRGDDISISSDIPPTPILLFLLSCKLKKTSQEPTSSLQPWKLSASASDSLQKLFPWTCYPLNVSYDATLLFFLVTIRLHVWNDFLKK